MADSNGMSFDNIELPEDENTSTNHVQDVDKSPLEEQIKERYKQNTHHRFVLVKWMMWIVGGWLFITAGIVITQLCIKKGLSDTILCTLLSTTTINVLGLAVIVLKGLFKEKD